ncbi:hypothetical protein DUNSADRAFT_256 [Dunaliella salina]|uniref:LIM zinc-binding domain-containing protein n=1 Tax=Dunaliella salina TaxID=3046 RepID=A0ABZ3KES9_DUNSA|nr:hypothetical protein DUNSADRAFT_256 [Dunaliella salina]|eukprot:KAF5827677.1 hypothetical protein DUNSADRAFT_256 [Dunaliella salina]
MYTLNLLSLACTVPGQVSGPLPAVRHQTCRECKGMINKGEPCYARDGRRIRLFYHDRCFSNADDPRSQPSTKEKTAKYGTSIGASAPPVKGYGKFTTSYGYSPPPDVQVQASHGPKAPSRSQSLDRSHGPKAPSRSQSLDRSHGPKAPSRSQSLDR